MSTTTPGSWIYEKGSVSGGGGIGPGGGGAPAPPVSIEPPVEVIFRSDHKVEVDIQWFADALATKKNFTGCVVYLEDPDISTGANQPLDGNSLVLNQSSQMSGNWAPVLVNHSVESPAVIPNLDSVMGAGQSYRTGRNIRIYLAAYGPSSNPNLVRATDTTQTPTPNILVYIPQGRGQGESGQEWAFLVQVLYDANKNQTSPSVEVVTDYNRLVPKYYLILRYTPPDPSVPVPPGINHFGGCRIVFVQYDGNGNPIFPGSDTGMSIPVAQSNTGFKSDTYEPSPAGGKFRVYFVSEDDSLPLGYHCNSLVEGTTPWADAIIPPIAPVPDVTNFAISNQTTLWFEDGSRVAHAEFTWHIPDDIRYAGVYLYLVNVTGGGSTLTKFPKDLSGPQSNTAANYPINVADVPSTPETWTIACISYDINNKLQDDIKKIAHSPVVTWVVGPPTPGSSGSGQEFAPFVTINPGASVIESPPAVSSDGVGMVSFAIGSETTPAWTNPTDPKFGNAQVAMVLNHDPNHPYYWTVPANHGWFTTPAFPSPGNIGSPLSVDFYIVSDDPQNNKNSLKVGVGGTPFIHYDYTPKPGAIIPARTGWFDPDQFQWSPSDGGLHAYSIEATNVYVGRVLVVGGAPDTSFAGNYSGQIAVKNAQGTLRAWMGQQQDDQGMSGPPLFGGWFGQLWVGGTSPLDAPLWVDPQGIIQVGGIAAAKGSRYPYLSIRDNTGLEMGRIGASITQPTGILGDNTGGSPQGELAKLTAGAWFTQLAVGGNNLANWNLLITPDTNKPLGSQFLMRNIFLLQIDYPSQQLQQPYNSEYKLEFGSSAWVTPGTSQWQFPGIRIYRVDQGPNNPTGQNLFGAYYLSRGMVLRGTQSQSYNPLVSLVTFNGDSTGFEGSNALFWGELAMYAPGNPQRQTVYLASGNNSDGNPTFLMMDKSGNLMFRVSSVNNVSAVAVAGVLQGLPVAGTGAATPVIGYAYSVGTAAAPIPVIDATGAWVGKPIASSGSQTPWTQHINAAGFALVGAGTVQAGQFLLNSGQVVIDSGGFFRGNGVDVGKANHVYAGFIATNQYGAGTGEMDTDILKVAVQATVTGPMNCNSVYINNNGPAIGGTGRDFFSWQIFSIGWSQNSPVIDSGGVYRGPGIATNGTITAADYAGGYFHGNGVNVGLAGIAGASLTINGPDVNNNPCASINGSVNCGRLLIGGTQRINTAGIYCGGLQWSDHVYGGDFGIYGYSRGWNGGFYDRDSGYHVVNGGILINNPPGLARAEQTSVVCDRCGSWQITYRRKVALLPRKITLSEAISEISGPKSEPGVPQSTAMVAECDECHFTVEYSSLMVN